MTTQPNGADKSPEANRPAEHRAEKGEILDLLLDALLERHAERRRQAATRQPARQEPERGHQPKDDRSSPARTGDSQRTERPPRPPQPGEPGWEPPAEVPSIGLHLTMGRLLLLVLILAILINVPVTRYGVALARLLPDPDSLVIRDGLLIKGSGHEVYILEGEELHWISSLDAFEHRGLNWDNVHEVDDSMLEDFEQGEPYHVLLKCHDSPHIYRLENEHKRWIRDIPTFRHEGHVWDDVRMVDCAYLRSIPMGPPIPSEAGPSPQP